MAEKTNVPEIRFAGFTDPWEQRKLGDEAIEIVAGGDIDKSLLDEHGQYPVIANALTDDGIVGYYAKDYRIMAPAVTVTGRGDVGHAKARIVDFTPVVRLLSVRSKHNVFFLENAINTLNIRIESTGVPQLTVPQLSQYEVFFPPTVEEEKEIGAFFDRIDNLITLHQREYDELAQLKKSMLDKMFPKPGERFPEIRFAGFTAPWEQRKLGELCAISSGIMGDSLLSDGAYHLTRIETIADGFVDETRVGFTNEKPDDAYLLQRGDILYSNINSITHMGKVAKYQGNSVLYHGINLLRLRPDETTDPEYLLVLLNTDNCRNWARTRANQAVSQASINQSLLESQELWICSEPEQKLLGKYFSQLDNLISLHQRKLELLRNIKKSLLDRMFV